MTALNSLSANLEVTLKYKEAIMKKYKKDVQKAASGEGESNEANHSKSTNKRRWTDCREVAPDNKQPHPCQPAIDPNHCKLVCRGLLALLLNIDHSCSADLFLLSCKVLARLSRMANLQLSELTSEDELIKLIELCIRSDLPWASYALSCLLEDSLENKHNGTPMVIQTDDEDASVGSGSWRSELLADMEPICETFDLEESFVTETIIKPKKISNHIGQLSSVYESDDSEDLSDFLDDVLERGRIVLKKPSKASYLTYSSSSAVDSRLEIGVEMQSEITLKRLIMQTTQHLAQTITSNLPVAAHSGNFSVLYLALPRL